MKKLDNRPSWTRSAHKVDGSFPAASQAAFDGVAGDSAFGKCFVIPLSSMGFGLLEESAKLGRVGPWWQGAKGGDSGVIVGGFEKRMHQQYRGTP